MLCVGECFFSLYEIANFLCLNDISRKIKNSTFLSLTQRWCDVMRRWDVLMKISFKFHECIKISGPIVVVCPINRFQNEERNERSKEEWENEFSRRFSFDVSSFSEEEWRNIYYEKIHKIHRTEQNPTTDVFKTIINVAECAEKDAKRARKQQHDEKKRACFGFIYEREEFMFVGATIHDLINLCLREMDSFQWITKKKKTFKETSFSSSSILPSSRRRRSRHRRPQYKGTLFHYFILSRATIIHTHNSCWCRISDKIGWKTLRSFRDFFEFNVLFFVCCFSFFFCNNKKCDDDWLVKRMFNKCTKLCVKWNEWKRKKNHLFFEPSNENFIHFFSAHLISCVWKLFEK